MSNVIPFDAGRPPAVFATRRTNLNQAAQQGVQASFAVIGYKGRNWRIKFRGEEQLLMNEQRQPIPTLDVVIVGVSPNVSKQYYAGNFVEGSDAAPDCFSLDGVSPDASSTKKQCATCATCPHNAWGSKVSEDGKKGKACSDRRRIAVVPLGDLENETYGGPMMLSLPPTSLGNLANYAGMLERKGASLEFVGTRLGFDYDVAYPRITFEATRWLTNEEAVEVVGADGSGGVCANPVIERMLMLGEAGATASAAAAAPDPLAQGGPAPAFQQRAVAPVDAVAGAPEPAAEPAQMPVYQMQPAPATAAPPKRQRASSAFQTAPAAAPQPAPQPEPKPSAVPTPVVTVHEAPQDMNAAIEELLGAPV